MNDYDVSGFNEDLKKYQDLFQKVADSSNNPSSVKGKEKKGVLAFLGFSRSAKQEDSSKLSNEKINEVALETMVFFAGFKDLIPSSLNEKELTKWTDLMQNLILFENQIQLMDSDNIKNMQSIKHTIEKLKEIKQSVLQHVNAIEEHIQSKIDLSLKEIIDQLQIRDDQESENGTDFQSLKSQLLKMQQQLEHISVNDAFYPSEVMKKQQKKIKGLLGVIDNRVSTENMKKTSPSEIFEEASKLRGTLNQIRSKAQTEVEKKSQTSEITSFDSSQDIRHLITSLYREGMEMLKESYGDPPCKYCIAFFGSLARQEAGPYPDIDHLLLIEKKNPQSQKYFQRLNQFVADRIFRLGESRSLGAAGLRFCEGGMNPIYQGYFFRFASDPKKDFQNMQSEFTLVETSIEELRQQELLVKGELEKLQPEDPDFKKLETKLENIQSSLRKQQDRQAILKTMGRSISGTELLMEEPAVFAQWQSANPPNSKDPIVSNLIDQIDVDAVKDFGFPELFDLYQLEADKYMNEMTIPSKKQPVSVPYRQEVVTRRLNDIRKWVNGSLPITKQKLQTIMDVKADLYRFPQVVIANLAILHQIKATSTFDRIRELQKLNVLDPDVAKDLLKAVDFCIGMRMKMQLLYGEEFEAFSSLSYPELLKEKGEYESLLKDLEKLKGEERSKLDHIQAELKEMVANHDPNDLMFDQLEMELLTKKDMAENRLKELEEKAEDPKKSLQKLEKMLSIPEKHHPLLSAEDQDVLMNDVLPVFHHLYEMTNKATQKGFNPAAFNQSMKK